MIKSASLTHFQRLPRAYSQSTNKVHFRQQPEHFHVDEVLNFSPSGAGDHLYLRLRKRNTNTDWLANELARKTGIKPVDVGYAGRKDRFAITTQWFSLHIPLSQTPDLALFKMSECQLIEHNRHSKKLRKGEISYNKFTIQLTQFEGSLSAFNERIELISKLGFPNYFGEQRFGHNGANIEKSRAMLAGTLAVKDRNKRSIYLSAARSYLFNLVLARRIEEGNWSSAIDGDYCVKQSAAEDADEITGPLPGDGPNQVSAECLKLETQVLAVEKTLCAGIANSRVQWHRRQLRVFPGNFNFKVNNKGIELQFSLKSGAYATSLLRELITLKSES